MAADARDREAAKRLAERDDAITAAGQASVESAAKVEKLERELREKETRLEQFLAVKAQADLAGALQIQNAGLERENRDLKERIEGLERERANALEVFGEKLMEGMVPSCGAASTVHCSAGTPGLPAPSRDPAPTVPTRDRGMSRLLRAAGSISALTLASRILGLLRDRLMAQVFGSSWVNGI